MGNIHVIYDTIPRQVAGTGCPGVLYCSDFDTMRIIWLG